MNFKYEQLQTDLRILREQRQLAPAGSDREKELVIISLVLKKLLIE